MRLSVNLFLTLTTAALLTADATAALAENAVDRGRYSIIAEPHDHRPGAITRPANDADRRWRRTRRSPELKTTRFPADPPRFQAPRYDAYGRRRNVPGRPDTLDGYGRAGFDRPRPQIAPIGPTVRTDAATRINQLGPRR